MSSRHLLQRLPLAFLDEPEALEPFFVDMTLDARADKGAKLVNRNGVQLDAGVPAELLCPRVLRLGRTPRKIPVLNLLSRDGYALEVNCGARRVPPKLLLSVARGVLAGGVVIAEVVDVGRPAGRLDHLGNLVQIGNRGIAPRDAERHVVGIRLLPQHGGERVLLAEDEDSTLGVVPHSAPIFLRGRLEALGERAIGRGPVGRAGVVGDPVEGDLALLAHLHEKADDRHLVLDLRLLDQAAHAQGVVDLPYRLWVGGFQDLPNRAPQAGGLCPGPATLSMLRDTNVAGSPIALAGLEVLLEAHACPRSRVAMRAWT